MGAYSYFLFQKGQAFVYLRDLHEETLENFGLLEIFDPFRSLQGLCAQFIYAQKIPYSHLLSEELQEIINPRISLEKLMNASSGRKVFGYFGSCIQCCYCDLNENLHIVDSTTSITSEYLQTDSDYPDNRSLLTFVQEIPSFVQLSIAERTVCCCFEGNEVLFYFRFTGPGKSLTVHFSEMKSRDRLFSSREISSLDTEGCEYWCECSKGEDFNCETCELAYRKKHLDRLQDKKHFFLAIEDSCDEEILLNPEGELSRYGPWNPSLRMPYLLAN